MSIAPTPHGFWPLFLGLLVALGLIFLMLSGIWFF
jgi:hypothetical protein